MMKEASRTSLEIIIQYRYGNWRGVLRADISMVVSTHTFQIFVLYIIIIMVNCHCYTIYDWLYHKKDWVRVYFA